CGTRFRVVADQLRISDGWVRCGQCQEVFDARNHLDAAVEAEPVPVEPPAPVATPAVSAASAAEVPARSAGAPVEPAAPLSVAGAERVAIRVPLPPVDMPSFGGMPPVPVPAPVPVPVPVAAPAPGYELPVPQWSDDLDLSEYQAVSAAPAPATPELQPPSHGAKVFGSTLPTPAEPLLPTVEPAAPVAALDAGRAEPVWSAHVSPHVASPQDFPALDPSLLRAAVSVTPEAAGSAPLTAADPAAVPAFAVASQNGLQSAPEAHSKLSETERLFPLEVDDEPVAPALPQAVADMAAPFTPERSAPPAVHVVDAEDTGPATVPLDEIESAAQKLAQAEPWSATGAASAAAPAFPLAEPVDDEDPLVLDSSLEPGFVRDARRKAWWQKPVVRVAMGAGVVVLPVALALQVALHERNALVAWQPSLRPALEFMCTALQCKLGPRQQIAAMVVSGSAFAKGERERSYQLSLSIQNRASTPVGMPAVELTLTDAQDQAIARKVIAAKELGAPLELKAGAEWSGAVPVTTDGLNLQVSGYRVLLFYP
ncbi:MAG: DUF3426 domain-containing protein, partial [Comamonas sp.]